MELKRWQVCILEKKNVLRFDLKESREGFCQRKVFCLREMLCVERRIAEDMVDSIQGETTSCTGTCW